MDFELSDLQSQLRESAERMLEGTLPIDGVREAEGSDDGFPRAVWEEACKLEWPGIALAEEWGGSGFSTLDLCVLLEEVGHHAATLPLVASSGLCGTILERSPQGDCRELLLSAIASGKIVSPVLIDEDGRNEWDRVGLPLVRQGDDYRLSGGKILAPFAAVADELLVTASAPGDQLAIVALDPSADGVTITPHHAAGGVPLAHVRFEDVVVQRAQIVARGDEARDALDAGLEVAALLSTAESVGLCEGVIEMTAGYVSTRKAFGQAIGAFQAVGHPVADLRVDTDAIRLLVQEAAWLLDEGRPASVEIATTKAYANEKIERIVNDSIQVHGAIGYSNEYHLQIFNRRLRAFCQSLGETGELLERAAVLDGL